MSRRSRTRYQHVHNARTAMVEAEIGKATICDRCGATLDTFADTCSAALDDPCPGFERIDAAKVRAARALPL